MCLDAYLPTYTMATCDDMWNKFQSAIRSRSSQFKDPCGRTSRMEER